MDALGTTVVETLAFLLPGFIAASIYYSLTPAPRPIPFERVVQALILTMVVQASLFIAWAVMAGSGVALTPMPDWGSNVQLAWSVGVAIVLGLLLAWLTNRDRAHALLRKLRITDQTSYASEWYGALCKNKGYIVLHLKGNRRLYGWPEEWPSVADQGHFVMAKAEWLHDEERIELSEVDRILVPATEVEMVELMSVYTNTNTGEADGKQEGTHATPTPATAERSW